MVGGGEVSELFYACWLDYQVMGMERRLFSLVGNLPGISI